MSGTAKEIRELVARAQAQGWRAEDRGRKILLYSPDGETIVTIHKTPSDRNWRRRAERHMQKGGYER
jgi:hypothetical protein